jgi:hypothetical protein
MMKMKMMKVSVLHAYSESKFQFFLEMRNFIVDDDDEVNAGFDYQKELDEIFKKNFRFDKQK